MFHHRVQSFNFLTFRFRLDKWWFGIPLLLRGPLMSLVVTCATNFPAAQVCLNSLILTIYIVIQAMARPWKVPLLNWVDMCISVLLIQITMLSGIAVSSEAFSDVFGGIVLGMFLGIIGLMLLAVGFAVLQELCAGKDAKDSIILSMFESRSTGLGNRLLAVANGVAQHEEAFLQDVLGKLNNHDLSCLENSIDLISFELMLGDVFHAEGRIHRIHSRAIAVMTGELEQSWLAADQTQARASVTNRNQDMVAAQLPQVAAADPADPVDPADPADPADPEPDQAISRDPQQTLTPEVAANPSSVAPEPAVPASNEEVTVATVTPPLPSSQEIAKAQIVSTVL